MFILVIASLLLISTNASSRFSGKTVDSLDLFGVKPDKFVDAAPLIVAASCEDGVAMIAVHGSSLEDDLVFDDSNEKGDALVILKDLPTNYRGPRRIHSLDGFGSSLICAGWRTDGDTLAEKCRSLASEELDRFGEPNADQGYGRYLAQEASFFLAQCASSDDSRAMSCVGLLSVSGKTEGFLWLVDATGSYRVRAHAVGNGAKIINKRLRKINFSSMKCQECIEQLMKIMMETSEDESEWKIPTNSRVEMALVESSHRRMKQVRQPFAVVAPL
jgi:20S proteasome alpha/beta subunit